jgi:hypothetical protein
MINDQNFRNRSIYAESATSATLFRVKKEVYQGELHEDCFTHKFPFQILLIAPNLTGFRGERDPHSLMSSDFARRLDRRGRALAALRSFKLFGS